MLFSYRGRNGGSSCTRRDSNSSPQSSSEATETTTAVYPLLPPARIRAGQDWAGHMPCVLRSAPGRHALGQMLGKSGRTDSNRHLALAPPATTAGRLGSRARTLRPWETDPGLVRPGPGSLYLRGGVEPLSPRPVGPPEAMAILRIRSSTIELRRFRCPPSAGNDGLGFPHMRGLA